MAAMRASKRVATSGEKTVDSSVVTMAASRVVNWVDQMESQMAERKGHKLADYSGDTKAVQRVVLKADQTAAMMEAQWVVQ